MAYQCHRCSGWIADTDRHICINDVVDELHNKLSLAIEVIKQIEIDTRKPCIIGHIGAFVRCAECETTNVKLEELLDKLNGITR